MTTISADGVDIEIQEDSWRLVPAAEELLSGTPVFWVMRGSGVMEYTPGFGAERRLPGTVLSLEYVRAVVIGYDEKKRRWRLGFHLARRATDKPRWLELVRWPVGNNELYAAAAQQAGRALSECVGCPLKIFGAKKLPRPTAQQATRSGVTGPLTPHAREDIGPQRVKLWAQGIDLPVQYPGMWLGEGRGGVTLRLAKDVAPRRSGEEAPAFNQCVFDPERRTIRLVPPTGLLGIFMGGAQGRVIPMDSVYNVELRHTIQQSHASKPDNDGLMTEITYTHHTWGVYLTLPEESLLLAQTEHTTSSEFSRRRISTTDKFSVDSQANIEFLRQYQANQEAAEAAETFARAVALVVASTLGVRLVKTEVGGEL